MSTRWGVLGTGLIASVFTRDLRLLDDAVVAAVASRRPGGAAEFAATYEIPVAYDSYDALIADPSIDLVYVAVPHSEHFGVARQAVRGGKNVLVEKPFTLNAWQAEQLLAEAREGGVFIMDGIWPRFLPHMVELRRLVDEGVLGDIVTMLCDHGIRFDPAHPEHRLYDPTLGGGALLDLGVYCASLIVSFLGDDLNIKTLATKTATGVDAELSSVIRDEYGRHGVMTTSLSTELSNRAVISGTKGRVEIDYNFMGPSNLEVYLFGDSNPARGDTRQTFDGAIEGYGLRFEAEESARCVREGLLESPTIPHALTMKVMRAMDEMRRQVGIRYTADEAVV